MPNLDDLFYFEAVVRHGGFAAAGRALDIPKSKLSRRVAALEERLDVRLLERSARRLWLTAVGEVFHGHCRAALAEAWAAEEAAQTLTAEPRGLVRLGCSPGYGEQALASVLPAFFAAYPKVRLQLLVSLETIDLLAEQVDVVIRANLALAEIPISSPASSVRSGSSSWRARPFSPPIPPSAGPRDLSDLPTIAHQRAHDHNLWELYDAADNPVRIRHDPRLIVNDFAVSRAAAIEGMGVAMLPQAVCYDALASGALVRVLPDYHAGESMVHLLFPSRRGMLPAVRVLVDHLIATLPEVMRRKCAAVVETQTIV
ncbi:LysR substrate-binding domain-containing protein [Aurantimonas sp. A2-1-M11]|uniref:LysR substrate-binding domain-containing protein n=1 Tax=Aurantimonas sp. A2-1-M11 TaxID=3113712 RepID=UPI002F91D3BD